MKILIACETSGTVRDAFRNAGHDAFSCDILPSEDNSEFHIQGDALHAVYSDNWDLLIAHPPCTYLSVSGMHWTTRGLRDPQLTEDALEFVQKLMNSNVEKICIENPVSIISTRIRKPDQIIQPYEFGHDASKKTCLWLKNLPLLNKEESLYVKPRIVNDKKRWANQTDSGQNKLGPSELRWKERSKTYEGVAQAMVKTWG